MYLLCAQPDEAELQRLLALQTNACLGLYADAVRALYEPTLQPTLAHFTALHVCTSALQRRGLNLDAIPAPARTERNSIPQMLLAAYPDAKLSIFLQSDSPLARLEALELALAALSFEFELRLVLRAPALPSFAAENPAEHSKGYASLMLFGLSSVEIEPKDVTAARALDLLLPWTESNAASESAQWPSLQF